MSQWTEKRAEFEPDGSLRDIYVKEIDATVWCSFLEGILASSFEHKFWYGEKETALPSNLTKIRKLQGTDPTTLKVYLDSNVQVNCHFFLEEEIEMDISPEEISNESKFNTLLSFLVRLAELLNRPVYLTQENTPGEVILSVMPENV